MKYYILLITYNFLSTSGSDSNATVFAVTPTSDVDDMKAIFNTI